MRTLQHVDTGLRDLRSCAIFSRYIPIKEIHLRPVVFYPALLRLFVPNP